MDLPYSTRNLREWLVCYALVVLFFCAFAGIRCGHASEAPAVPEKRILFIGNSFTSVNNLPVTFQHLAASGGRSIYVDQVSPPGWTLLQHAGVGSAALAKIRSGRWDFVVLQEQSQVPAYENLRPDMYRGARILDEEIRKSSAKTVFFLTWGYRNGDRMNAGNSRTATFELMQAELDTGTRSIAGELNAIVCPVGTAWMNAVHQDSKIHLWAGDDKHPTREGTYLAACVFYATLLGASPVGLKYVDGVDPKTALFLQQVAAKTCAAIAAKGATGYGDDSRAGISRVNRIVPVGVRASSL